ncbi:hypothetical protein GS909_21355 [Rhodococcus hoagii]|nr:hypothetical protein [Prescottella equi]
MDVFAVALRDGESAALEGQSLRGVVTDVGPAEQTERLELELRIRVDAGGVRRDRRRTRACSRSPLQKAVIPAAIAT